MDQASNTSVNTGASNSSDEQQTDTFDWSISNITVASDFKPDILDSHVWSSPSRKVSTSFLKLSFEPDDESSSSSFMSNVSKSVSIRRTDEKLTKMMNAVKDLQHFQKFTSPRRSVKVADTNPIVTTDDNGDSTVNNTLVHHSLKETTSTSVLELKTKLQDALNRRKNLEGTLSSLEATNASLTARLERTEGIIQEKDEIIQRAQTRYSELNIKWMAESTALNKQLQIYKEDLSSLKTENLELHKRIETYEKELEKALSLASDFKTKIEDENKQKEKMLDDLVSERALNSRMLSEERSRIAELTAENNRLLAELNPLKSQHLRLKNEVVGTTEKFHSEKLEMQRELQKYLDENETLKSELDKGESNLHAFYQNQMEAILAEKLQQLKTYIEDLEKTIRDENASVIEDLKAEHQTKITLMKERYASELQKLMDGFSSERSSFQTSLNAARREADALREQLQQTSFNHLTSSSSLSSQKINLLQKVENEISNLRLDLSDEAAISGAGFASLPTVLNNQLTLDQVSKEESSCHSLTQSEKEEIVKGYVKKYLDENPECVFDTRLMSGLNDMVRNLVFSANDTRLNNHR